MPYNTRRKSLSLPSLGIQLPNGSRAHRSPIKPTPTTEVIPPPSKKIKRSHDNNNNNNNHHHHHHHHHPVSPISSPGAYVHSPTDDIVSRPKSRRGGFAHTPPPSPGDSHFDNKIDTEGINDDIVIAVIEQLEKTGNRPHLIKELATVLASTNDNVAKYVYPVSRRAITLTIHPSAVPPILLLFCPPA